MGGVLGGWGVLAALSSVWDAIQTSCARKEAMRSAARLLRWQWDRSCERLLGRLEGLTHVEYRWEPAPACWNVRADPTSPSGWTVDYPEVPPPPPPPVTTIVWRLLHIADGNTIYWEHAFGPGQRNFWDLVPHGDAAGAVEYLEQSQRLVTGTLAEMDDTQLDEMRPSLICRSRSCSGPN